MTYERNKVEEYKCSECYTVKEQKEYSATQGKNRNNNDKTTRNQQLARCLSCVESDWARCVCNVCGNKKTKDEYSIQATAVLSKVSKLVRTFIEN